jgi:hypothetical protein
MISDTSPNITFLKAEVARECSRIATDLGLDVEGEAVRHGLFTISQARGAFDGCPTRVSLTRLLGFMFTLRTLYNYNLPYEGPVDDEPFDDGIPY